MAADKEKVKRLKQLFKKKNQMLPRFKWAVQTLEKKKKSGRALNILKFQH